MRWPKMPPLTAEQSQLAADNFPLVLFAVRQLWRVNPMVSLLEDDAIGEGYLALVKAARIFNPARGIKFSTYAMRAIKTEVAHAAERWSRKTFVPDLKHLYRQLNGACKKGIQSYESKNTQGGDCQEELGH